ncbi:MAG: enoyl-CoA hydratase-related protein [Dehalococcoidales bacterium]|nr:enoyl-CoA hydratase-related protein [Dehalococcoidales bacterium]
MSVDYKKTGSIAYITLNQPEVMNAMTPEDYETLHKAFTDADEDTNIRVGIITGAGTKAFSSGADLRKRHAYGPPKEGEFWSPLREPYKIGAHSMDKPWIAAINSYCLAGALELALCCDILIASENSSFGSPEICWSILNGVGALKLIHAIPRSAAMELLLTGERIDAKTALQIGLISRMVPQAELMPTAEKIARRISENGPVAVKIIKELAVRGLNMTYEDGLNYLAVLRRVLGETQDTLEGPKAYVEKRKPVYKGR